MDVEAFLLCDCATDQQGKLNILGAFDNIWAKQLPTALPACTIAARIRFSKIEEDKHKIRINIIDADGNPVVPDLHKTISVHIPANEDSVIKNLILNIQGLKLENYGQYRVDLAVDGRQIASVPLKVRQIPEQAQK